MSDELKIRQMRYEFSYPGEIQLHHDVPTVTLRGAFGYALAQVIAREANVPEFSEQVELYRKLFMPENDGELESRNHNLARPFVLRGQYSRPDKRSFVLDVNLFGCTVDYESFFDSVVEAISYTGIGPRYQVCRLQKIFSRMVELADPEPDNFLKVRFITPCSRMKSEGQTFYDEIPFYVLFSRLADRVRELDHLYGTCEAFPDEDELYQLKMLSREILWHRLSGGLFKANRTSRRTQQTMRLDGFQGEMGYCGNFVPFRKILKYLPYVNLGHFNVFGCGWCDMKYLPNITI